MKDFRPVDADHLILQAQKPTRYVGGEVNAIQKDLRAAEVTWALAFPDVYEVGMSNLGFRVLYHVLNRRPETAAERTFMPWTDMAGMMRKAGMPLFTLESRAPVRDFDIVGITLQFELCYTTVLGLLDLAGIPLLAKDRGRDDPLVIGGGPCAYSPEPVAPFFDLFVVGEAEEVVHEINDLFLAWKREGGSREELLWELAEIRGVYVPSLFDYDFEHGGPIRAIRPRKPGYTKATRRVVPDLNTAPFYEKPVLPFMQTIHDRLPIEIQRGCTRGCRFCQVGMLTRPTRQRDPKEVLRLAKRGLETTGYEEVSFLSLSAGDYQCLNGMLEDFFEEFAPDKISVGIPSLRTETMNERLAQQIRRVRKGGFTVAPEAASERMRRVINKGNEESDLLHAVETIFGAGWDLVKFYFMIGLPTERDEDVLAIGEVAHKALRMGRKHTNRATIHVGVSTFVPKPFTPFQWEPHLTVSETRRKQRLLREAFGPSRSIDFKYPDAEGSEIEAFLCLGDRRVATAILAAYRMGQVLDGWGEFFSHERWRKAAYEMEKEWGVGLDFFAHRERGRDEILPWDTIDCEVTKPYLWRERERSHDAAEVEVPDCAIVPCHVCGACDYEVVKNRVYDPRDYLHEDGTPYELGPLQLSENARRAAEKDRGTRVVQAVAQGAVALPILADEQPGPATAAAQRLVAKVGKMEGRLAALEAAPQEKKAPEVHAPQHWYRLRYAKTGRAIALSHLETSYAVSRALRRAQLPISFSEGFNPRPRLSFGPALPVGVESEAEYLDLALSEPLLPAELEERLGAQLPAGFRLVEVGEIPRNATALQAAIEAFEYRVAFPAGFACDLPAAVAAFAANGATISRERPASKSKGTRRGARHAHAQVKEVDLKAIVGDLVVDGAREVTFRVRNDPGGSARPTEVIAAVFGGGSVPEGVRIRKESVRFG